MRNNLLPIGGLILLVLTGINGTLHAQGSRICEACQEPITGKFYWFRSSAIQGQKALCFDCSTHDQHCFQCRIPVRKKFLTLEDGRQLCEEHRKGAVLTQRAVELVFEQTKRSLFPMLNGLGVLPDQNIRIQLVDAKAMAQLHQKPAGAKADGMDTMGLTRTEMLGPNQFNHVIFLLSGLSPARVTAIAAHEYGHVWLHENVPADRIIDNLSMEAFCELVAYRLMTQLGDEVEKNVILQNAYTRGQINAFRKADDEYQFFNVVQWMKKGDGDHISQDRTSGVLNQKRPAQPSARWALPIKTKVPDTLMLKGISGNQKRRFALVNNQTLALNAQARVRVGDTNVMVRCLEIRDRSVLLQVHGNTQPLELTLD